MYVYELLLGDVNDGLCRFTALPFLPTQNCLPWDVNTATCTFMDWPMASGDFCHITIITPTMYDTLLCIFHV